MKDSMIVLYSGETDVNILAGFVTNVNLVLQPTGQGTGSVHIYVTWGSSNTTNYTWSDNPTNPVIAGGNQYFDYYGIAQPVIMYDENKYKLWYYGDAGNVRKYVLYAESADGINWVKHPNPVLVPGNSGSWIHGQYIQARLSKKMKIIKCIIPVGQINMVNGILD